MQKNKPIITVDGLSGCGKGTISYKLAKHLDFYYLETELLYKAFAYLLKIEKFTSSADIITSNYNILDIIGTPELNDESIELPSSIISQDKLVKKYLREIQRQIAFNPPDSKKGAILDGCDIGITVCPEADCKIFIKSSLEERAMRKILELKKGYSIEEVLTMLKEKDARDLTRTIPPAKYDSSYFVLDNTDITINESYKKILSYVGSKLQLQ